jgi:Flp pilus assembly protein TadG
MPLKPALKRSLLGRLRSDKRGVAAIEFALIAPVAILLYCGFAELTMAMMAERRAAHAASVVADLVAQEPSVSTADMTDIFNIANAVMTPFPAAPLKLRVTSVVADPTTGVPTMNWTRVSGGAAPMPAGAVAGFPPTLLAAGESVIQADVQYAYTSPLRIVVPNALNFSNTFYLRPRRSASVALVVTP